jgi:hypothetical protein
MDRLLATLTPIEKQIILKPTRRKSSDPEPKFRPKINKYRTQSSDRLQKDLYARLM